MRQFCTQNTIFMIIILYSFPKRDTRSMYQHRLIPPSRVLIQDLVPSHLCAPIVSPTISPPKPSDHVTFPPFTSSASPSPLSSPRITHSHRSTTPPPVPLPPLSPHKQSETTLARNPCRHKRSCRCRREYRRCSTPIGLQAQE